MGGGGEASEEDLRFAYIVHSEEGGAEGDVVGCAR